MPGREFDSVRMAQLESAEADRMNRLREIERLVWWMKVCCVLAFSGVAVCWVCTHLMYREYRDMRDRLGARETELQETKVLLEQKNLQLQQAQQHINRLLDRNHD